MSNIINDIIKLDYYNKHMEEITAAGVNDYITRHAEELEQAKKDILSDISPLMDELRALLCK